MSLKNKLFVLIISIITSTLILSGFIYINNVNNVYEVNLKKELDHDKKVLKSYINDQNDQLLGFLNEIKKDEDIISSLYLIENYEDKGNYDKNIFNFERKKLIRFSNKWINEKNKFNIAFFKSDGDLLMVNRELEGKKTQGFVYYDNNNEKLFFDTIKNNPTSIPQIKSLDKKTLDKMDGFSTKDIYLFCYTATIHSGENILGYIRVGYEINNQVLKSLINKLANPVALKTKNGYIFEKGFDKENFEEIKNSKNHIVKDFNIIDLNEPLIGYSLVNKEKTNKEIKSIYLELGFIWILILFLTLIISILFIKRFVLDPIKKIKNATQSIKENNFKNIDYEWNDELGDIIHDFNSLSKELADNLSFLNSYKNIMDKGNIVTKSDLKGNITYVNDNFVTVSGYSKEESIGAPHSIVRDPEVPKEVFKELWDTIQAKKTWRQVLRNRKKDGGYYWVDLVIEPIIDNNGNIIEYMAVRHDITELIEQREKLKTIATTDKLTALGNRFKLQNDIKQNPKNSIAIFDIDNFRQFNDFYGQSIGDKLIIKVSDTIKELIEKENQCFLYRLQGDQFVLRNSTLDRNTFYDNILKIVQIISNTEHEFEDEKISIKLTAAISFETNDKLLQSVDMALQIAKKKNLDIYIYKDEESLDKEYANNIKWAKKIKNAIETDNIIPFYQPIVDNESGEISKYESLIRLKDDEGKIISPYFFLDIAKNTKYYSKLSQIMIEKTFARFKDEKYEFSINLTIDDILNHDVQTTIFIMLETTGAGNRAIFEIVESESIENFDKVLEFIKNVKSYNCKVAIDDFGTGYSNFEYLMKLEADIIKIDGSMIKNIHKDKNSQMVVSTIVDFAKRMDMKVTAEFVEDENILNVIKILGIEYSQGYYFAAPKEELQKL